MAKQLYQLLLKCPACRRWKNSNYFRTATEAKATCICGARLVQELQPRHFSKKHLVK